VWVVVRRLVLALDTATEVTCVGLARWPEAGAGNPQLVAERNIRAPRAALSSLLPAVRDALASEELVPAEIDAVVCGRGPGSYTGVRIGMATAKGLAQGLGVPLLGVGTLDAVAAGFAGEPGLLGVVGDAMRDEVYPALFDIGEDGFSRRTAHEVATPDEVAERWASETEGTVVLAGDGLIKHVEAFASALGDRARVAAEDRWWPSGSSLLAAAWAEHGGVPRSGEGSAAAGGRSVEAGTHEVGADHPGRLLPVYTNLSDAERMEGRTNVPPSGVTGPAEDHGGDPGADDRGDAK
jgi:N6-L-threonylcarbamoyladenine synthase/protein kinase Bud32